MYNKKILILIILIALTTIDTGCSEVINSNIQVITSSPEQIYKDSIDKFQTSLSNTFNLYSKDILQLDLGQTDEYITSVHSLIDIKTKEVEKNYADLSNVKGDKQDQVDILKKGLDKLLEMNLALANYKDNINNRKKILDDWKIATNYWSTWVEM